MVVWHVIPFSLAHRYQHFEPAALVTTGFSKMLYIFNNLNGARDHNFNNRLKSQV